MARLRLVCLALTKAFLGRSQLAPKLLGGLSALCGGGGCRTLCLQERGLGLLCPLGQLNHARLGLQRCEQGCALGSVAPLGRRQGGKLVLGQLEDDSSLKKALAEALPGLFVPSHMHMYAHAQARMQAFSPPATPKEQQMFATADVADHPQAWILALDLS